MAYRHPSDASPEDWYEAAKNVNQNHAANKAFKLAYWAPGPAPAHLTTILVHVASQSIFCPQAAIPTHPTPSNAISMDIDGSQWKNLVSPTCYQCHQPSHKVPDCPLNFDIRSMTIEELEMELMVKKDKAQVGELPLVPEETTKPEEDFVQNNEWQACPCCLPVIVSRYCQIYRIPKQTYKLPDVQNPEKTINPPLTPAATPMIPRIWKPKWEKALPKKYTKIHQFPSG